VRSKLAVLAGIALSAALLAGCGGGGGSTATATGAASIVPEDVSAFVAVDTNLDSSSWKKAEALLNRFPGKDSVLSSLRSSLEQNGLTWGRDVKPALGSEIDFVWLDFQNRGTDLVGLTRPKDVNKFNALIEQGSSPSVHEQIEGWTVFANGQAQLDRFKQLRSNGNRLDGNSAFTDAMDGLPSDSIARVFVKGGAIQAALDRSFERRGLPSGTTADQLGKLDSFGAAVTPESNGIRIVSTLSGDLKLGGSGYHADLASSLPSGAIFYYSFNNLGGRLKKLVDDYARTHSGFDRQRAQVETALGMSLDDVFGLMSGEGALALYRTGTGSGTPQVVFALRVSDEGKARRLLEKAAALAQLGSSVEVTTVQIGGLQAREFDVSGTLIYAAVFDGKLVVTNSRASIAEMHGSGPKLAEDPAYTAAVSGAAMPSETNGFLYSDLSTGLDYAFAYVESQGSTVPSVVRDNTGPLRGLLLYSTTDGSRFQFTGFLGIQ
jgi:uncharacterized protein DUF3352